MPEDGFDRHSGSSGPLAAPTLRRTEQRRIALLRPAPSGLGADRAMARSVAGRHPVAAAGARLSRPWFHGRSDSGRRSHAAPLWTAVPSGARNAAAHLDPAPDL